MPGRAWGRSRGSRAAGELTRTRERRRRAAWSDVRARCAAAWLLRKLSSVSHVPLRADGTRHADGARVGDAQ
eukprot:1227410-Prymnesium_polylepis.1